MHELLGGKLVFILLWLFMGGIAGWLASLLTKNNQRMGIFWNIVVGLVGSLIGGYISQWVGLGPITIFSFYGMLFSILGAVILLSIVNLIRRGSK